MKCWSCDNELLWNSDYDIEHLQDLITKLEKGNNGR